MRATLLLFLALLVLPVGVLVLALALAGAQQPSSPECQSLLRVEQESGLYTKQVAARLLLRAEKAEQELAHVQQLLAAAQAGTPPPKE